MDKIIFYISALAAIFPQQSVQQEIVTVACNFFIDEQNRYTCELSNFTIRQPNQVLLITGNHLPGLSNENVLSVRHTNVEIAFFNGEIMNQFPNVNNVEIFGVLMQSINARAFENCWNLTELNIGFNRLEGFPGGLLSNCHNIRTFRAGWNILLTVPGDLFGTSTNLEILDLNFNRLFRLPSELLQSMRNLRILNIRTNVILGIGPNDLDNSRGSLEELDAAFNLFNNTMELMQFLERHLTLKRLRLNTNIGLPINFDFFTQFQQLEELAIGGWQLRTDVQWQALPTSLTNLFVTHISENIPADAFARLIHLKRLEFSGVGINQLQNGTFDALNDLEQLWISGTRLNTIPAGIFRNQAKLTTLMIDACEISELPAGVFSPLVNLGAGNGRLSFHRNRLRQLNSDSFGQHRQLRNLDFGFNDIERIEPGFFENFSDIMDFVDFTRNACASNRLYNATVSDLNEALENCFPNGSERNVKGSFAILMVSFTIINILF